MVTRYRWVLFVLVLTLLPAAALAGGIEVPDNGTRAMGRAGAYSAAVAEPSAMYYNPAALTQIDGFALTVNANLWFFDVSFQRSPLTVEPMTGTTYTYPFSPVENEDVIFPAPMLFMSHDFGLEDWDFGFGVYGPSAIGIATFYAPELDELDDIGITNESARDFGHGYLMESSDLLCIFFSGAVAYDFGPVQLGLTVGLALLKVSFINAGDGGGIMDSHQDSIEDPALYTRTSLDALGLAPTGTIGVRVQPIEPLTLSLSYRPRIDFNADGDLNVEFPPSLTINDLSLTSTTAHLNLLFPDMIRFGSRWAFLDGDQEIADIELDFVYEFTSQTEQFTIDIDGDVSIGTLGQERELSQVVIAKQFNDVMSFRLGGDVHVTDDLTLRAGSFIEGAADGDFFSEGATQAGYGNFDFPSFRRIGLSLGASYQISDWSIDLAYMHIFSNQHEETDGQVDIIYPLWVCEDPPSQTDQDSCDSRTTSPHHAVNNGTYDVSYNLVSVGFTLNLQ